MPKKHIVEFATYAGIGGTQQMLLEFLRHASHDKFIYSVCILLDSDFLDQECAKLGLKTCILNMRGYWDLRAWWKFYRFIKDDKIDLIRTYGLKAHIIGRIMGKLAGATAHITSVRSTDPWRKWYHSLLDFLTSGLTDVFISNSEAGRIVTHQREHIPLSKIVTIHNGIDLTEYIPDTPKISACSVTHRTSFGISPTDRVMGTIANFRTMKGHKTIVDALPRIQEQIPNIKCLFVGTAFVKEKYYEAEIRRYVQEQHLDHAIVFTGARRDIPQILSIFDIFLLPSLWEGFSTALLEAMAMKVPVIASDVGGNPEIIEQGITGILIPPQDPVALAEAVIHVLTHPNIVEKMRQAGYERVQHMFSLDSLVATTETVYEHIIERKQKRKK